MADFADDTETIWRDLKAFYLAHQTFTDSQNRDTAIHRSVADMNAKRKRHPLGKLRISA